MDRRIDRWRVRHQYLKAGSCPRGTCGRRSSSVDTSAALRAPGTRAPSAASFRSGPRSVFEPAEPSRWGRADVGLRTLPPKERGPWTPVVRPSGHVLCPRPGVSSDGGSCAPGPPVQRPQQGAEREHLVCRRGGRPLAAEPTASERRSAVAPDAQRAGWGHAIAAGVSQPQRVHPARRVSVA